jgi:hypothetical protein
MKNLSFGFLDAWAVTPTSTSSKHLPSCPLKSKWINPKFNNSKMSSKRPNNNPFQMMMMKSSSDLYLIYTLLNL